MMRVLMLTGSISKPLDKSRHGGVIAPKVRKKRSKSKSENVGRRK